ncbi:Transcription activator of gluconeogenesis [Trichinella spiralis]|uniref:Transcription activator of gluconeogenesis n=1 Tax=Trichinella spiralis TaxID=6334 RepID=A0ABR3L192_TRISP
MPSVSNSLPPDGPWSITMIRPAPPMISGLTDLVIDPLEIFTRAARAKGTSLNREVLGFHCYSRSSVSHLHLDHTLSPHVLVLGSESTSPLSSPTPGVGHVPPSKLLDSPTLGVSLYRQGNGLLLRLGDVWRFFRAPRD